ncbi:hypothetical protein [Halopenitus persicus]|uniref:Lipoprotein n=1 Tax=Halopenitus persicus TaxID=1048396 RepID=A0A1H3ETS6_9EURY|nr:hypothetical protein [Halopenitus persicus]SDX82161.1 hypothetical protein SAMN05216564_101597 [Halopenitus persicus]
MRRAVLALSLALLVVLAGCTALPFGDDRPPSDDRALETLDRTAAAASDVETYRFEARMRASATADDRERTATAEGSGAVNVSAERLRATTRVDDGDGPLAAGGENEATIETYVDGNTSYRQCRPPWSGWAVESVPESDRWRDATPLSNHLTLLERSRVYWRGDRTVDGNRTVLIEAYPTRETIQSLAERRQTAGETGLADASLENATARLWVDPETDLPVRSRLRLEIARGDATATATLTTTYRGYGEPVSVTIPPAATVEENQYELGCPGD